MFLPPSAASPSIGFADGMQAVVPRYVEGELQGVRVDGISPGSLAEMMGLKNGDVLLELAGMPCDRVGRCRAGRRRMEAALMRRRGFRVLLERNGAGLIIEYRFHELRPLAM